MKVLPLSFRMRMFTRICLRMRIFKRICLRARMHARYHTTLPGNRRPFFCCTPTLFHCWISIPHPSSDTIMLSFSLCCIGIVAALCKPAIFSPCTALAPLARHRPVDILPVMRFMYFYARGNFYL